MPPSRKSKTGHDGRYLRCADQAVQRFRPAYLLGSGSQALRFDTNDHLERKDTVTCPFIAALLQRMVASRRIGVKPRKGSAKLASSRSTLAGKFLHANLPTETDPYSLFQ